MNKMDHVLRTMSFEFFGAGKHKLEMEKLLTMDNAVFLDVRGTRSAIVYAFLRAKGYESVRVVLGGYEAVASLVLPGKLLKHIEIKKAGE